MEIILRDYQQRVVDDVRAAVKSGKKRILVSMPTGAGKSATLLHMALAAKERGNRTAVMVERITLATQWYEAAQAVGLDFGVIQGDRTFRGLDGNIYSQQTSEARSEQVSAWPEERLVVVDEIHQQRKMVTEYLRSAERDRAAQIVVGLTATPMVEGLGDTFDHLVQGPTTTELTEQGWLIPFEVWSGVAQMDMESHKPTNTGEWAGRDIDEETASIVGDIVREWARVARESFDSVPKTICFSSTVASGKKLVDEFNSLGMGEIAAQVSYKDTRDDRDEVMRRLRAAGEPDELYAIVNVSVLGRGWDYPEAAVLIDASPYRKAFASYAQMIGRVLRPRNKRAEPDEKALVMDFCGNFGRFFPQWHDFAAHGVRELLPDPEPDEKSTAWECPDCETLTVLADGRTCRGCGLHLEDETTGDEPVRHVRVWLCEKCGEPNRQSSIACVSCGARRRDAGGGGDDVRSGWECPVCSGLNPHGEYRCGHRDSFGKLCGGEKPEKVQRVKGRLERFDGGDPVGVMDKSANLNDRKHWRYVWCHICELATRHYLTKQKSVTPKLVAKAEAFARARFQAMIGSWSPYPFHSAREPRVDPRIEGVWKRLQAEYAAQAKRGWRG